ncbi:MAG: hypothetical protein JST93_32975 [Acidobacteria bacterium]|nr:hypothetical protein [Acidobacteriota bacterium]
MTTILTSVQLIATAGAALLWLWSAIIYIPDLMQTRLSGPESVTEIMRKQSRMNAIAALFASVAAATQATLAILGQK